MKKTILFLCPHHAAKSLLAEAYFNRAMADSEFQAISAGTEPDEGPMPSVVAMLGQDGIDVSAHRPRRVTPDELRKATRIISMGCTAEELALDATQLEVWSDVPPVSQDPDAARLAILDHLNHLIQEL